MSGIKMRARSKDGVTEVKALMSHPMAVAREDKATGEMKPPHFIKEVTAKLNGKQVMHAWWSAGVSKNPYLAFKVTGASAGDTVSLSWVDNKGDSESKEVKVS
jgi:sulfur-oxidizing protein SoxZ